MWEDYATIFGQSPPVPYEEGRSRAGGAILSYVPVPGAPAMPLLRRTGAEKWTFAMTDVSDSGILTTASDLLFTGGREGYFQALDARTGALLWKTSLGGQIVNGPITYAVDGKQYVATIAGHSLVAFALRD